MVFGTMMMLMAMDISYGVDTVTHALWKRDIMLDIKPFMSHIH